MSDNQAPTRTREEQEHELACVIAGDEAEPTDVAERLAREHIAEAEARARPEAEAARGGEMECQTLKKEMTDTLAQASEYVQCRSEYFSKIRANLLGRFHQSDNERFDIAARAIEEAIKLNPIFSSHDLARIALSSVEAAPFDDIAEKIAARGEPVAHVRGYYSDGMPQARFVETAYYLPLDTPLYISAPNDRAEIERLRAENARLLGLITNAVDEARATCNAISIYQPGWKREVDNIVPVLAALQNLERATLASAPTQGGEG